MLFLSKCIGHRMHISVLWKTLIWGIVCSDAHSENYAQYVHIKLVGFHWSVLTPKYKILERFMENAPKVHALNTTKISSNNI